MSSRSDPSNVERLLLTVFKIFDDYEWEIFSADQLELLVNGVKEVLKTLTPREREIINLRFALDGGQRRTIIEIGKTWGLTKERIRQIEMRSLEKLRTLERRWKLHQAVLDAGLVNLSERTRPPTPEPVAGSAGINTPRVQFEGVLATAISELNLSVRARKALNRLGIATIGELVARTPGELLESKNFGHTSLQEVKDKLAVLGLKLQGD